VQRAYHLHDSAASVKPRPCKMLSGSFDLLTQVTVHKVLENHFITFNFVNLSNDDYQKFKLRILSIAGKLHI